MLHKELYHYNPEHLAPWLRDPKQDFANFVKEEVEQIYRFNLFTPEYCKLLIEEAEHCGKWQTQYEMFEEDNPLGVSHLNDPETTLYFEEMPGLEGVFFEVVDQHIKSLTKFLWTTFDMQKKDNPFILKYEPSVIKDMELHFDNETVALLVYLSDPKDYEGGGTYFPRWNYSTGKPQPGEAVIYPGGVSHEHMGLEITAGKRYLLACAFF